MNRSTSVQFCVRYGGWLMIGILGVMGSARSTSADDLRYRIEPEQVVAYRVTIEAETPAEKDTMSGVIAFTGKTSEPDQFTIIYRGGLTRKKQAKTSGSGVRGPGGPRGFGRPGGGPPIPRGPMGLFGAGVTFDGLIQSTNELVVGRTGEIKSLTGESQLPYLMGNLSILPFEALPEGNQKQWNSGAGITIVEGQPSRFPRGPFRSGQETTTGGSEQASYSIRKDDGKEVTVQKNFRLHSPAATKDDHSLEITGNGTFVFNRELGVPESLDFKQNLVVSSDGASVTVPMTVAWNRISEQEYQAHLRAREEQIAALREKAEQRQSQRGSRAAEAQPLAPSQKQEILAELSSGNVARVNGRLGRLMNHKLHPDDADLAQAVRDLQSHKNIGISMSAKRLWQKWSAILEESRTPRGSAGASASDNPFKSTAEKGTSMREWTDASGSFKIEATLLLIDGENVVLKKKDGKEITVPVSRLSTTDQAFLEGVKANLKPDNPFE